MTADGGQVGDALGEAERLYSDGLHQHGVGPKSVGWKDEASQLLRFTKLAAVLDTRDDRPVVINDLGCGYAAMFEFLDQMDGVNLAEYRGFDISAPMLNAARERTDSRAQFVLGSEVTQVADYSFVSGTFNVRGASGEKPWTQYVKESLLRLSEKSRSGFAFNALSTFVDYRTDGLFYADPAEFFVFCKSEISPYVTLVHDYQLYEWTMLVRSPADHA